MSKTSFLRIFIYSLPLALCLSGSCANVYSSEDLQITDKTLVAWVYLHNLGHRVENVLILQDTDDVFDAIISGDLPPARKWIPGSDPHRTERNPDNRHEENADSNALVQIAVVSKDRNVSFYRNGEKYAF